MSPSKDVGLSSLFPFFFQKAVRASTYLSYPKEALYAAFPGIGRRIFPPLSRRKEPKHSYFFDQGPFPPLHSWARVLLAAPPMRGLFSSSDLRENALAPLGVKCSFSGPPRAFLVLGDKRRFSPLSFHQWGFFSWKNYVFLFFSLFNKRRAQAVPSGTPL